MDWRHISTAPRDRTLVEVIADGDGPFRMRWNAEGFNPLVSTDRGIWEAENGAFTWCEDRGAGPAFWRPISGRK